MQEIELSQRSIVFVSGYEVKMICCMAVVVTWGVVSTTLARTPIGGVLRSAEVVSGTGNCMSVIRR